ncbi:MAG: phosphoenolpyruvate-utilizing N-terminal domain-containing protein, partial [Endomicrobiaceae bacterium]|nr:phosphoenolpyruvate-utilizing N-terminal domain-containing protein [Endomicrobiaceae bacterium]
MTPNDKTNIILTGVPASPGVAIGKVFLFEDDELVLIEKTIPKNKIKDEITRLNQAIVKTKAELQENQVELNKMLGKSYAKIADAHVLILNDPMLNKDAVALINEGNSAEFAIYKVTEKITKAFDLIDDEYFRERKHDIVDVAKKLMRHLQGKQKKTLADLDSESIVVSKNLTPSDTVSMREVMVRGFATDTGGKTSHTALVAQSLEIPAVVGLKNITSQVSHGMSIIVDGK